MSAILEEIIEKIERLSEEELDVLLSRINAKANRQIENFLEQKAPFGVASAFSNATNEAQEALMAKYLRPQPKNDAEFQQMLRSMLSPEQIARLNKNDFSKLPPGKKSASKMIIEGREDRV
jgi:hypothetical protein